MAALTHRLPRPVALALAFIGGGGMATQVRVNATLGEELGDGLAAAAISFGLGLVICVLIAVATPGGRAGFRRLLVVLRERTLPWWALLGGIGGASLVMSQGVVGAVLGVALFTVAVVAGQTLSGLFLDTVGFGPAGRIRPTVFRLLGAGLIIVAVLWSVGDGLSHRPNMWPMLLPLIAGMLVGVQQALNGRVQRATASTLTATLVNFTFGAAILILAFGVKQLIAPVTLTFPSAPWLYTGGIIGCIFIALGAFLVSELGVLVLAMATVSGQLVFAVVLDIVTAGVVSPVTIGVAALALVAAMIAGIPSRLAR